MKPKFLGGDAPDVEGQDPRKALAEWLTVAGQRRLLRRRWPTSSGRTSSAAASSSRWTTCASATRRATRNCSRSSARSWPSYGFDKKKLVRDICNSRTYQLSAATNPTNELDEAYFSHGYVRRLRAEVLLDTITRITGTEDRFPQSPPGTRAVQIHTGEVSNYFLTTFGRAPRETACSCEVNREANLSQALHLVNGDTITQKIAQGKLIAGAARREEDAGGDHRGAVRADALPQADRGRERRSWPRSSDARRPTRTASRSWPQLQARLDPSYQRGEERLQDAEGRPGEAAEGQQGSRGAGPKQIKTPGADSWPRPASATRRTPPQTGLRRHPVGPVQLDRVHVQPLI